MPRLEQGPKLGKLKGSFQAATKSVDSRPQAPYDDNHTVQDITAIPATNILQHTSFSNIAELTWITPTSCATLYSFFPISRNVLITSNCSRLVNLGVGGLLILGGISQFFASTLVSYFGPEVSREHGS